MSADDENSWRDAFVDLEIDDHELEKQYVGTMQDQRFNVACIQESHCFDSNMQGALDPRSVRLQRSQSGVPGKTVCPEHVPSLISRVFKPACLMLTLSSLMSPSSDL